MVVTGNKDPSLNAEGRTDRQKATPYAQMGSKLEPSGTEPIHVVSVQIISCIV